MFFKIKATHHSYNAAIVLSEFLLNIPYSEIYFCISRNPIAKQQEFASNMLSYQALIAICCLRTRRIVMKKILPIILCAAIVFSVSGCMGGGNKLEALSNENVPKADSVKTDDYKDNLDGLEKYLKKRAFLPDSEPTEMTYSLIGAIGGHRYMFSFNNSSVTAEFYEFDLNNLNDDAKRTIKSVKEKGEFELLDISTKATLSDNGKYLMIYTDNSGDETNTTRTKDVLDAFKAFKK